MKLQIINIAGTFEIIGNLTLDNTVIVKEHFNYLLDHYEEVVMCLNKVKKIDKKGIAVLKETYAKANKRSKVLFVLGKENEVVSNAFKENQVNYIFRDSY
ncbi:hypothetical protein D1816_20995 [Aquimarina sp. AD10]|uniref:hypothetical protein n=1 Tax=Aquimarina sp. AD10 TaxID=1714849 RepID=UPI000E51DBBF|nr:hypothetical protein [Aquimarina sp. AD10]AXT62713.1 hypothetical protein D1816_20995 [Aquimarina sp. AD10]RKN01896.1 hypothetical protein D7033_02360 [Aquimarina sp. AD10]